MTRMCDLPAELVGMIFTKIPVTSMRAVRSTCKSWNALTKDWILGKAASRGQLLGFMTMDNKICSLRLINLYGKNIGKEEEDLVDLSVHQIGLLNQVDISTVIHSDGLLLCVAKDNSRLMVWNPYLGQTRWISSIPNIHNADRYVVGYDVNHNPKIMGFMDNILLPLSWYQIYDFSSNSWRALDVSPDWIIEHYQCVSLKGNSYFFAREKIGPFRRGDKIAPNLSSKVISFPNGYFRVKDSEDFLLCFDFTRERFGPHLPLPFHSKVNDIVALSCIKEEQLAVLYQHKQPYNDILHIWITTSIEPSTLSWSKFLTVEMSPFVLAGGSFLVDEEEKVAVVFGVKGYPGSKTSRYQAALVIGKDGYFKSVRLGEAPEVGGIYSVPRRIRNGYNFYFPLLMCSSSYVPSLVQLYQPCKRKERDY